MDSSPILVHAGLLQSMLTAAIVVMVGVALRRIWLSRSRYPEESFPLAELPAELDRETWEKETELLLRKERMGITHGAEFRERRGFVNAVSVLEEDYDDEQLWELCTKTHLWLSLVAGVVLLRRHGKDCEERVLASTTIEDPVSRYTLLSEASLLHPADEAWVESLLPRLNPSWLRDPSLHVLGEMVAMRWQMGERATQGTDFANWFRSLTASQNVLYRQFMDALGEAVAAPWVHAIRDFDAADEYAAGQAGDPATTEGSEGGAPAASLPGGRITDCGKVWTREDLESLPPAADDPASMRRAAELARDLMGRDPRPVVIVGAPRTGKSTLVRRIVRQLLEADWKALEATPLAINAGMSFVGQLEGRARELIRVAGSDRRFLWVAPELNGMLFSGISSADPYRSLANLLRQALEGRKINVLGECTREEWTHACLEARWLEQCFEVVEVELPSAAETIDLVDRWYHQPPRSPLDREVLEEAWQLVRQFQQEDQRPGKLFDLLRRAEEDAERRTGTKGGIERQDLHSSLSRVTGLPLELLDVRQPLEPDALERHFRQRIRGQDEAVRCVVDRVSMIKAGVTDPTRPLGVFLFAGPTGTGKTELSKALAEWLFGSESRLIRLDMSEFQDAASLNTLLGSAEGTNLPSDRSFVDRVRRQPYSVILLDEFEKAAPRIWDLFLQVFDDGRLSDRQGRTVDFRHSVILLTTNLGSRPRGARELGFTARAARFDPERVHVALRENFRPEFLNRLDRILIFRPLTREVMGRILQRQIQIAIQRRGLRDRPWAVEWDDAALEFLIDKGFSEELGARPLQRALEQYLLTPLARRMVAQNTPEGDQFLFVSAREGSLSIDFVDPDTPIQDELPAAPPSTTDTSSSVAQIALQTRGSVEELAVLESELGRLEREVDLEQWVTARRNELEMTSLPEFWESPDRFEVLELFAARERVERALVTARSLLDRLSRTSGPRIPVGPLRRLALRLHLLGYAVREIAAGDPTEVLVIVQVRPSDRPGPPLREFSARLREMYRAWASRRGARLREWEELSEEGRAWVASVQSFGAWSLLSPETGLHVWERHVPSAPRSTERDSLLIQVLAVPAAAEDPEIRAQASRALASPDPEAQRHVVRRYRVEPDALVRDSRRGWRTGRLEWVLAGDFDLISPDSKS